MIVLGDGGMYHALDNETPRQIATKLGIDPSLLVKINKKRFKGLSLNAKLQEGTALTLTEDPDEKSEPSSDTEMTFQPEAQDGFGLQCVHKGFKRYCWVELSTGKRKRTRDQELTDDGLTAFYDDFRRQCMDFEPGFNEASNWVRHTGHQSIRSHEDHVCVYSGGAGLPLLE